MAYLLQQLVNAVPLAAIYAALAFGYALVFGLTKRTDFAFGALFAFAGQIFLLFAALAWQQFYLVLGATLAMGAAAAVLYTLGAAYLHARHIVRPLMHGRPNAIIAASLGVLIVLMELARIGSQTRSLWIVPIFNEPVTFLVSDGFPVTLTRMQIACAAVLAMLVASGQMLLVRSNAGLVWRAVRDDSLAAALCGIDALRTIGRTYALASLLAAVAGVLTTINYGTMEFGASLIFGLKVVFIAAIGGTVSPGRAAVGAAAIALGETLWSAYAPLAWRDLAIFTALVFVLVLGRGVQEQP